MTTDDHSQAGRLVSELVLSILQLVIAICFCVIFYIFYSSFRGEFLIVVKGMWILPLFLALLVGGAVQATVMAIVSLKAGERRGILSLRFGSQAARDVWRFGWALWNIIVGVPVVWVGKTLIMGALGSVPNALIVALSFPFFGVVALLAFSSARFLILRLRGHKAARLMRGTVAMGFAFLVAFGLFVIVAVAWRPQWTEGVERTELFTPGDEPGRGYRIPAMIVLPGDVLLAFAESRVDAMSDLLDIDIVMRRSLDGGKTWGPLQVVYDEGRHTVHSPTPLYDADTGTVWLPFCIDYATLYILLMKQGIFSTPMSFNFVWGVAGGQCFRPGAFVTLVHALPPGANFTTCGVGREEFPAIMQSCLMGGHMRVGLEDNVRAPNGDLVKGSYELVEWAVRVAEIMGRAPATPDEARVIMGLRQS